MTEEERAWRFMRRGDAGGETVEEVVLGTAVRDTRVPLRYDSNYLFVERPARVDEILAELDRLDLPVAVVPGDAHAGDAAVQQRGVVMVHRGPHPAPPQHAVEVGPEALEPIRRAQILRYPWGTPEIVEQLLRAKRLIAERVTLRCFAALDGGSLRRRRRVRLPRRRR